MAMKKTPKLSDMTAAQRQARIAKLAANPGTRSAIPDQYLPAKYQQARKQAAYGKQEAAPGLTNHDLAVQRQAATTLQYGPNAVQKSQQQERDTTGWYDQYRQALQQAQSQEQQIGANATTAISSLAGAMPKQDVSGQSAQNQTDAGNAAAVRQAIIKNIGAVQTARAGNANSYANTLANVVAPTQKLQAQSQGRQGTNDLRDKIRAFGQQFDAQTIKGANDSYTDQQKTNLALQSLGLDVSKANASAADATARTNETIRSDKAREKNQAASTSAQSQKSYGPGAPVQNKFGYTYDEWTGLSDKQRTNARAGKGTKANNGVKWVTPTAQSSAQSTISKAIDYAKTLKGKYSRAEAANALTSTQKDQSVFETVKDPKTGKTTQRRKLNADGTPYTTGGWTGIDSALASAALDMAYDGHLSAYTVNKLHNAGIKVDALGYPTKGRPVKRAKNSPSERAPGGT